MFEYQIKLIQGEVRPIAFLVNLNKRPMDISAHTCQLTVKKHYDDDEAVFAKFDASFTKTYAEQGLVSVDIGIAEIGDLAPGDYFGQLKITDSEGYVRKTEAFPVEILPALDIIHLLTTSIEAGAAMSAAELTIS
jgi:hypothetical protein